MNPLFSSDLEESSQYMGKDIASFDISGMTTDEVDLIKHEISARGERRGYKNLVIKVEKDMLYVF